MEEAKEIRKLILDYYNPFNYGKMLNYLIFMGHTDNNLNNQIIEELFDYGLLHYEKVLPENEGNLGYAFVTDAFYEKKLKDYSLKRLDEIGIKDSATRLELLDFVKEVINRQYLKEDKKTR